MPEQETILLVLFGLTISGAGIFIGLVLYLGKWHVKKVDKVVYGYEFPNDSIFALLIRVPNYAGAFTFKWSAKRSGLDGKLDHFDTRFRQPFILTFWIGAFSFLIMIISIVFHEVVYLP